MAFWNNIKKSVKTIAQGVGDGFKENPLESAYNTIRDAINGVDKLGGSENIPISQVKGGGLDTHFIPRDNSLKEGFDDWTRLIDYNLTDKEVLDDLIGDFPNQQLVYLFNTARKFNINSELQTLVEGALTTDPPQAFGRLLDLNHRKFRYGINDFVNYQQESLYDSAVDKIEDPTILSFTIEIDMENSPLFIKDRDSSPIYNFLDSLGEDVGFSREGENTTTSSLEDTPYDNNIGLKNILEQFIEEAEKIFNSFETNADTAQFKSKSYYLTDIAGVEKLDKIWFNGEGDGEDFKFDRLTFSMREDVKMTARNLAFLYNSLKYHRRSGRQLIPENLLRFNMWIKISEIRNYTSLREYIKGSTTAKEVIRAIRRDVTSINYYVQDCEFDFNKFHSKDKYSTTYTGFDEDSLDFDIIYRRAYRLFKPTLMYSNIIDQATVYHIDERKNNPAVNIKFYSADNSKVQNGNFPFKGLTDATDPTLFGFFYNDKNSKKRTIIPDGLVRGDALFRDVFNQNTREEATVRNVLDSTGNEGRRGNLGKDILNLGIDFAEGYFQNNVNFSVAGVEFNNLSVRGIKDSIVQKSIRAANQSLTEKRDELVRDLNNKIKIENNIGKPSPNNIYAQSNTNNDIDTALNMASRITGVNFNEIRNSQYIQQNNPSLGGKPLSIGKLEDGYYSEVSINPNDPETLNADARYSTVNYDDGKLQNSKHSTYQTIKPSGINSDRDNIQPRKKPDEKPDHEVADWKSDRHETINYNSGGKINERRHSTFQQILTGNSLGRDVITSREEPKGDLHDTINYESGGKIAQKNVHSTYQEILEGNQTEGFDRIVPRHEPNDDRHPDIELGNVLKEETRHPDDENVLNTDLLNDRHPDDENVLNTDLLGDRHPDDENVLNTDLLNDRHPDDENVLNTDLLGDRHPDDEAENDSSLLGDRHPDDEAENDVSLLGDRHPDDEAENDISLLDDRHPDDEAENDVSLLGDRHPDDESLIDEKLLGDRHPDDESNNQLTEDNLHETETKKDDKDINNNRHNHEGPDPKKGDLGNVNCD
jgi:hypothetical protein